MIFMKEALRNRLQAPIHLPYLSTSTREGRKSIIPPPPFRKGGGFETPYWDLVIGDCWEFVICLLEFNSVAGQ